MKKTICILLALILLLGICACGQTPTEQKTGEWTRQGYFTDENGNILYVLKNEDLEPSGWTVGILFGEQMTGATIPQEGGSLHGNLNSGDENAEPFIVTVTEEGEDGSFTWHEDQSLSGEDLLFERLPVTEG